MSMKRRPPADQINVTVSGSFRRHMQQVQQAVYALTDRGATVLSPADPRVVDAFGDFVFVASDRLRTVRVVQSRHLAAIEHSDFLWVVTTDGYVGPSTAMEIGWAVSRGIPVFAETPPDDLTFRQFVTVVGSMREALDRTQAASPNTDKAPSLLLTPHHATEYGHDLLESLDSRLRHGSAQHRESDPVLAGAAQSLREMLSGL